MNGCCQLQCSDFWLCTGCNVRLWLQYLHEHTIKQPLDCLKVSVPAIVYMLQNNLLYVALSNLEAATFQVRATQTVTSKCWCEVTSFSLAAPVNCCHSSLLEIAIHLYMGAPGGSTNVTPHTDVLCEIE